MRHISIFATLIVLLLVSCRAVEPKVMAEDCEWKITMHEEDGRQVLTSYNKKTGQTRELLHTSPHGKMFYSLDYEAVDMVHKDSVLFFDSVEILPQVSDTLFLMIEDTRCSSTPNVHSFVYRDHCDSLMYLPTNMGFMGITSEEFYLVMQSYKYDYELIKRCKYNVIDVYDVHGRLVSSMEI